MTDPTRRAALAVALDDIEAARKRLRGAIVETDCDWSRTLSQIAGCKLWLKFENLQFTASFKERGALNRLSTLSPDEKARGVIAMSAGNHAQGVAYHAHRLSVPATIVMPVNTPTVKVVNTQGHGAEVILEGETVEQAAAYAHDYGRRNRLTFIHPYDDPLVIAGQGTIALEMLGAAPEIDTLVVPIGGGGLISGIAVAARAIRPDIRLFGVQAKLFPSMYNAVKGTHLPVQGETLAEGIAVRTPGRLTQAIVRELVDDIVLVSEQELEHAVSLLINIEKTVVEGAGAAGLAAVLANRDLFQGRTVGLVLCGGNIDARLLAGVLTRELAREGRLTQLSIDLVDRPGALASVANSLAAAGANIVEVTHQRVFSALPAKRTLLDVVIETRDRAHLQDTVARLRASGLDVEIRGNSHGAD
ncbi:MAG TPA: threonine ammonia-lyase [Hyphomicrobiaceae bacterium]|jgi:threonine dehydratase|nr:threonine ammonia-lyase [Hyphomicrobiaceae bacterium]